MVESRFSVRNIRAVIAFLVSPVVSWLPISERNSFSDIADLSPEPSFVSFLAEHFQTLV